MVLQYVRGVLYCVLV